jgi:imidazolonepropionase-like amidohydrolase
MLAIRTPRMFDGEQFSADGCTLLVRDGRIVGVEDGYPDPGEQWRIVEYPDATMVPGLIDTHVHLVADSADGALDRVAGYTDAELDDVITDGLHRQLAAGVTTVRDLGDRRFCALDRRDRQRSGASQRLEPTILAAGPPLTNPAGHCYYLGGEIAGRAAIAAAIRERAERGVDIVKVMASGGMATPGTDVLRTQFSTGDLQFLVDRAHAAGLPVTAHAHGLPAVLQAIEVGVDGIEHCSCLTDKGAELSDELIATLADRRIAVGGAIGAPPGEMFVKAPQAIQDLMRRAGVDPEGLRRLRLDQIGRMHRGGVRLVTGADSGIAEWMGHGRLHQAVAFLVDSGASIAQALVASTSLAAEVCGVGERKGRLRNGYDADVLVVNGDLAADVGALTRVRSVVLGGEVVVR